MLVLACEVATQGTGAHGQHYVVYGGVGCLADTAYALEVKGLRHKPPGTRDVGIDRRARHLMPGH